MGRFHKFEGELVALADLQVALPVHRLQAEAGRQGPDALGWSLVSRAIILLIFRDTILGIVASLQANATSMVRVGDWISIPKYIEGIVEDISINSIRIGNFDNSVTTLPTCGSNHRSSKKLGIHE